MWGLISMVNRPSENGRSFLSIPRICPPHGPLASLYSGSFLPQRCVPGHLLKIVSDGLGWLTFVSSAGPPMVSRAAPVTVLECNRLLGALSPCSCELTEGRMAPPSSRYPQCRERAPERNSANVLYKLLVDAKEGTFGSRRRCQAMIFELDSIWLMDLEWGGTVSKEAFQTEAVYGTDQCRGDSGLTGYQTVLCDRSLACSSMDGITRRLFV